MPVFFGKIVRKSLEQPFLAIQNLYQSFWEILSEKFKMAIFGHSKFVQIFLGKIVRKNWYFWPFQIIPVFLGKIVRNNLQWQFLAILDLFQSFWEKLSEIIWNSHFWPVWIYASHSRKNCQKKYGMATFCHSKVIPVFLGTIVRKNLEWPFLAILNFYQSFWEKLSEKFRMAIFGYSEFIQIFFGKIVWKNLEWWFLVILNWCQSFWEKLSENFGMAIFGHSKFIQFFLGKIVWKNLEWPFLAILNLYQSFQEILSEKFRMAIFGHSKFIEVFLGKIVRKNLEWWFLVILNLYKSFWEKLSEIIWNSHFWPVWIYASLCGKNCQKKYGMAIFCHSKVIPVFLGKIVRYNLER